MWFLVTYDALVNRSEYQIISLCGCSLQRQYLRTELRLRRVERIILQVYASEKSSRSRFLSVKIDGLK